MCPGLETLVNKPFAKVEYADAIELLKAEIAKEPSKWQFPDVEFGTDLSTEHERWLAETKFKTATFVYNYPRSIKAFYMRDNEDGKTVAATDLLVPGIGELIGGSQREERLAVLEAKLSEFGLSPEVCIHPSSPNCCRAAATTPEAADLVRCGLIDGGGGGGAGLLVVPRSAQVRKHPPRRVRARLRAPCLLRNWHREHPRRHRFPPLPWQC